MWLFQFSTVDYTESAWINVIFKTISVNTGYYISVNTAIIVHHFDIV